MCNGLMVPIVAFDQILFVRSRLAAEGYPSAEKDRR
jgi:hypothetical protein